FTGYHENGGYAEFAVAPEAYVYPIPHKLSDREAAPLLCSGIIGYRALKRSRLPDGGSLAIFGFGSSAHLILQIALGRKATVHVISRSDVHRALAKELGAKLVVKSIHGFPTEVDSAIVFAPAGEVVPQALSITKRGGTVVLAGIHMSAIPWMNYEKHLFFE